MINLLSSSQYTYLKKKYIKKLRYVNYTNKSKALKTKALRKFSQRHHSLVGVVRLELTRPEATRF